jgi:hypothetical protein
MAASKLPRAGRAPRTPGHVQPPRGKGALPVAGRKAADVAAEVYPSKPQPSGSVPDPQGSPGS